MQIPYWALHFFLRYVTVFLSEKTPAYQSHTNVYTYRSSSRIRAEPHEKEISFFITLTHNAYPHSILFSYWDDIPPHDGSNQL
jgi:hypothetical protein